MRLPLSRHRAALSLMVAGGVLAESAEGAVRKCLPALRTEGMDTASETEARRIAIDRWLETAATHGKEFTRFALSAERSIDCRRDGGGAFVCAVTAMPCAVLQNPNLLPPEAYEKQKRSIEPQADKKQ